MMKIETVSQYDYPEMLAVWENSVRATHHFIDDNDIEFFKPIIINQAFPNIELRCVRDKLGAISGFIGVHQEKIEMLFVLNEKRSTGIGKALLTFAMSELQATKVDVNEQNPEALGFYQHIGFNIISRSATDDMGKPFPILHLSL